MLKNFKDKIKKAVKPKKIKIKLDKQHLYIIMALFFIGVFTLVLTSSYAFFSTTIRGKEYVVTTGTLSVNFHKTGNVFDLTAQYPMTDADGLNTAAYTFGVKNTGSITARYQVRLVLDDNVSNIPREYIKIAYKKNNGSYSDPIRLSDLNTNLTITSNDEIEPNVTDNFELKIWIDLDAPIEIANKKFKGKIAVDGVQNTDDGYLVTGKPVIKLNKDSNGNIDMLLNVGDTYNEPGVELVLDDKDVFTPSDVEVNSNVDTSVAGIYTVAYSISDSDGNITNTTRTVAVGNEETLDLYKTGAAVVTANSTDANKAVVLCSHIYGNTDIYFNCEEQASIETAMSARNTGAIILKKNVTKSTSSIINSGQDYLLLLNEHTITSTLPYVDEFNSFAFDIYGDMTIYGTNGIINGTSNSITTHTGSNLTIDGGTYFMINCIGANLVKMSNLELKCTVDQNNCYPMRAGGSGKYVLDNITVTSPLGKAFGWVTSATGTAEINNSNFTCLKDNCVWTQALASSVITFNNTNITSYGYALVNGGTGTVNVNNSTLRGRVNYDKTSTNGGVFATSGANGGAVTNIRNSVLRNENPMGTDDNVLRVYNDNTLNVYDSVIESPSFGIYIPNTTSGVGTANLYNCEITAVNPIRQGATNGTINIYSGKYISTSTTVAYNTNSGRINLYQTDKPLYMYSPAAGGGWWGAIHSHTNGVVSINGHKADYCTDDPDDTTSGLCIYSEMIALRVGETGGRINVDGASIVSKRHAIYTVSGPALITIKNADIDNSAGEVLLPLQNDGSILKVCSSTVKGNRSNSDLKISNSYTSTIEYSNDVIFTDGTNTPYISNSSPNGTITNTGTCSITAQDLQ